MTTISTDAPIVLVTGASGFLGGAVCRYFAARGFRVRALVRQPDLNSDFHYDLPYTLDPRAFEGRPFAVIHCAHDRNATNGTVNVKGALHLRDLCRKHAVPHFVFISSLASHASAQSTYGKSKYETEQALDLNVDTVLRPGTIIGSGGLFSKTRELVNKMPLLPLFYPEARLQTVWLDDVCEGLFQVLSKRLTGSFSIADETGTPMREYYAGIAALVGKSPWIVSLPGDLFLPPLRLLELLARPFGLGLPITAENLLGLKCLKIFDVSADLKALGVQAATFKESLLKLVQLEKRLNSCDF